MLKVRDSHLHCTERTAVQVSVATNAPSRRPDVLREIDMPFLR